jgi:hypothetical protein
MDHSNLSGTSSICSVCRDVCRWQSPIEIYLAEDGIRHTWNPSHSSHELNWALYQHFPDLPTYRDMMQAALQSYNTNRTPSTINDIANSSPGPLNEPNLVSSPADSLRSRGRKRTPRFVACDKCRKSHKPVRYPQLNNNVDLATHILYLV